MSVEAISLTSSLALVDRPWTPAIVAELNGQHVKLARFEGEFVWHRHEREDELFLVLAGRMRLEVREPATDGAPAVRVVELGPGEMAVVPRGVEHRPAALPTASVLLFEPAGTVNTGDAGGERTVEPERI